MPEIFYKAGEMEKIEEMRKRLRDIRKLDSAEDNGMIVRFLRARNGDVNAAEAMLRKDLEWRIEENIDNISSYPLPEVVKKYFGFNVLGFCKDGSPIIYIDVGKLDTRGILMSAKAEDPIKCVVQNLEHLIKVMKEKTFKLNKLVSQWFVILNFESFSLSVATHKTSLEVMARMISIYESHYPELLKNAIIINASWYFQLLFAFIKPLITGHTLQKVFIFGKGEGTEELLKHIDADELPAFLGGNKTDPDGNPMCNSCVVHSSIVPESYYAVNNRNKFTEQADVKKLHIKRLSKEAIMLNVLYSESVIEWEFQTSSNDIALSLLYRKNHFSSDEPIELFPKRRYDTSLCPEMGLFKCDKPGTYYLEFDNRYSWVHSKDIYYKVQVVLPENRQQLNDGA